MASALIVAAPGMSPATAQSSVNSGVVTDVHVDSNGFVIIRTSVTPTGRPTCATNTYWSYVFMSNTSAGQAMLAAVLTAKAGQNTIKAAGSGDCAISSVIETLDQFDIV